MDNFLTSDRKTMELISLAKSFSLNKAPVLIQGECGTGKKTIADLIHKNSNRVSKPILTVNCKLISKKNLESALFGSDSLDRMKPQSSQFLLAHQGTLLLDEVSELDLNSQQKLLQFMQTGVLGNSVPINVKILVTTSNNLSDCVEKQNFNDHLYQQLNAMNIQLSALRDRLGDVRLLASHFLKIYAQLNNKKNLFFSEDAIVLLESYDWPGNITELKHVVEQIVMRSHEGVVSAADIKISHKNHFFKLNQWVPGKTLYDIEKLVILEALEFHKGNRTHTARALGISIRTLRNKIADYKRIWNFL